MVGAWLLVGGSSLVHRHGDELLNQAWQVLILEVLGIIEREDEECLGDGSEQVPWHCMRPVKSLLVLVE